MTMKTSPETQPTPETNAAVYMTGNPMNEVEAVHADVARKLERERDHWRLTSKADAEAVDAQACRIRDLVSENVRLGREIESLKASTMDVNLVALREELRNTKTANAQLALMVVEQTPLLSRMQSIIDRNPDMKPETKALIERAIKAQLDHHVGCVTGDCIEIGDDDTGQPRLVIHTTRDQLMAHGRNLAFATVEVRLAKGGQ